MFVTFVWSQTFIDIGTVAWCGIGGTVNDGVTYLTGTDEATNSIFTSGVRVACIENVTFINIGTLSSVTSVSSITCAVIASDVVATGGIVITFVGTEIAFVNIFTGYSITRVSSIASASESTDLVFTGGIVVAVISTGCTFINIGAIESITFETIIA